MPVITIIGYTQSGREVRIEVESHGDANRDISDIAGIDRMLSENGILPVRPTPGAGEQTQTIKYILRRKQKNKDGSYTAVMDLYGDKFRWVSCYLNDKQRGSEFYQATGLDPNKMPLSPSPVKEILLDDPETMSLFVRLNPPVEIIWKLNPKWRPDLSEEEKKKTPKRYFVRWASVAASASNGASNQKVTTPPPGQPRRTSSEQSRRMAADNSTREEIINSITVSISRHNGSHYYSTIDGSYTFTREKFREAGVACDHWKPSEDRENPGATYAILPAITIVSQRDEKGYWKIIDVKAPQGAYQPAPNYVDQPAPDFDPDAPF